MKTGFEEDFCVQECFASFICIVKISGVCIFLDNILAPKSIASSHNTAEFLLLLPGMTHLDSVLLGT